MKSLSRRRRRRRSCRELGFFFCLKKKEEEEEAEEALGLGGKEVISKKGKGEKGEGSGGRRKRIG